MHNDLVMVAVDMRVDAVQTLKELAHCGREMFWERDADARGEGRFVVDVGLDPRHQVFDVFGGGHLGGFGVAGGRVLPEVFESKVLWSEMGEVRSVGGTYSSVAFISGHDCGEQNSVMDP
jgi:hypothetical protein